jgi:hypothetical protein
MGSSSKAAQLTPAAITQQLDKHIVGQAVSNCPTLTMLRRRAIDQPVQHCNAAACKSRKCNACMLRTPAGAHHAVCVFWHRLLSCSHCSCYTAVAAL